MKARFTAAYCALLFVCLQAPGGLPRAHAEYGDTDWSSSRAPSVSIKSEKNLEFALDPKALGRNGVQLSVQFFEPSEIRNTQYKVFGLENELAADGTQKVLLSKSAFLADRPAEDFQKPGAFSLKATQELFTNAEIKPGSAPNEFQATIDKFTGTVTFRHKIEQHLKSPAEIKANAPLQSALKPFGNTSGSAAAVSVQVSDQFKTRALGTDIKLFQKGRTINEYIPCGAGQTLVVTRQMVLIDRSGWDWINDQPFVTPKGVISDNVEEQILNVAKALKKVR